MIWVSHPLFTAPADPVSGMGAEGEEEEGTGFPLGWLSYGCFPNTCYLAGRLCAECWGRRANPAWRCPPGLPETGRKAAFTESGCSAAVGEGQGPREGGGAPGSQRRACLDGSGRMGGFQEVLRKTGGLAEKGQCGWSSGIAIPVTDSG